MIALGRVEAREIHVRLAQQRVHFRLIRGGAETKTSSGIGIRVTCSATLSASCSSGSLTGPMASFGCKISGNGVALKGEGCSIWFALPAGKIGVALKSHEMPGATSRAVKRSTSAPGLMARWIMRS